MSQGKCGGSSLVADGVVEALEQIFQTLLGGGKMQRGKDCLKVT